MTRFAIVFFSFIFLPLVLASCGAAIVGAWVLVDRRFFRPGR